MLRIAFRVGIEKLRGCRRMAVLPMPLSNLLFQFRLISRRMIRQGGFLLAAVAVGLDGS